MAHYVSTQLAETAEQSSEAYGKNGLKDSTF